VIGTFTTRTYATRADWIARRESGVYVARNAFTTVGMTWMWRRMVGMVPDTLAEAEIVVGDGLSGFVGTEEALTGENQDRAGLTVPPEIVGSRIVLRSTFTERQANFDWMERGIVVPSGVLIDRSVADQGRKVFGAVWDVEAELELVGG
jgi:hypothetical protein